MEDRIVEPRGRERRGPAWLGAELAVPARAVSRVLARRGQPRLCALDPMTGEVIRASKATARPATSGPDPATPWPMTTPGRPTSRTHGIDRIERVMTDNAWAYQALDQGRLRSTGRPAEVPPTALPWQNGKAEQLNRTLATEWAYRQLFTSNDERAAALAVLAWALDFADLAMSTVAALGSVPSVALVFRLLAVQVSIALQVVPGGAGLAEIGLLGALRSCGVAAGPAAISWLLPSALGWIIYGLQIHLIRSRPHCHGFGLSNTCRQPGEVRSSHER